MEAAPTEEPESVGPLVYQITILTSIDYSHRGARISSSLLVEVQTLTSLLEETPGKLNHS